MTRNRQLIDHWQYFIARGLPLGLGMIVMPLCARLYPSSSWSALALILAAVGLASAAGASLRPLTLRALKSPLRLRRVLNAKVALALSAGAVCGVAVSLSLNSVWQTSVLAATLAAIGFVAGDLELAIASLLPARQFRNRLLAAGAIGNGLQLALGWISPTEVSLLVSSLFKSCAGLSMLRYAVRARQMHKDVTWLARQACNDRKLIGASMLTSCSRAASTWFQLALLDGLGLSPAIAAMYLVGRYIDPVSGLAVSAMTDMTMRLGVGETRPSECLSMTFYPRLAAAAMVACTASVVAMAPTVFVGDFVMYAMEAASAAALVAAMRVFVSPNAWIPYQMNDPWAIWVGEAVRILLLGGWALLTIWTPSPSAAIWGLAASESLGYCAVQVLIHRSCRNKQSHS